MIPILSSEIIDHFSSLFKSNGFSLKLTPFSDSWDIVVTKDNQKTAPHHISSFLLGNFSARFVTNVNLGGAYKEFSELIEKDLDGLPISFLSELYDKSKFSFYYSFLSSDDLSIKFLTHPETLEKINLKNLNKYCKKISPVNLYLFIQPLMDFEHSSWINKEQDIKGFLKDKKYFHALQKVFPEFKKSVITENEIESVVFLKMDFTLLIQSKNSSCHNFSSINKLTDKLISHFNAKRPDSCPIEEILTGSFSSDGIKKIMVCSSDKLYVDCFFEKFIDNLNHILDKCLSLSSSLFIEQHNKPLKTILQETQTLYQKEFLSNQLHDKPPKSSGHKI